MYNSLKLWATASYSLLRESVGYPCLKKNCVTVRNFSYMMEVLGWKKDPDIDVHLLSNDGNIGLNGRKWHDAKVLAGACANESPKIVLEIGTAEGRTTALLGENAPESTIYTVNIPPEEIGDGGQLVTQAFSHSQIGHIYKERGIANVHQILANTKNWVPEFGPIDIAFIDGCHDWSYVFNDTVCVLKKCRPGSLIIWHDFNMEMIVKYNWIAQVSKGVEALYRKGFIEGPIYHLQDSYVGLYRVPVKNLR